MQYVMTLLLDPAAHSLQAKEGRLNQRLTRRHLDLRAPSPSSRLPGPVLFMRQLSLCKPCAKPNALPKAAWEQVCFSPWDPRFVFGSN